MTDNTEENKADEEGFCLQCNLEDLLIKHKTLMGEIIYRKSLLPDANFGIVDPITQEAIDELSVVLDLVVTFHWRLEELRSYVVDEMTQACNKSENSFEKQD